MKLECKVMGIILSSNQKPGKPCKGFIVIGKGKLKSCNGPTYQLQVSTSKARNQPPISVNSDNIRNMITTHVAAGKATLDFVSPNIRLFISEAAPERLTRFIEYVKKIRLGENPEVLDNVKEIKSTELQVQTKLSITSSNSYHTDYAKNFPTTLVTLSITDCPITRVDVRWFANTKLTTLILTKMRLGTKPEELRKFRLLCKLTNLKRVEISHNELMALPNDIVLPKSLIEINLSHNFIEYVPDCIKNSESLVLVNLSHNPLKQLPKYKCWPRLKKLYFNDTHVSTLPFHFAHRKLDEIRCSNRSVEPPPVQLHANLDQVPTLETLGAAAVKQYEKKYQLPLHVLPWCIDVRTLTDQCSTCLKWRPVSQLATFYCSNNSIEIATAVDTLSDITIVTAKCHRCRTRQGRCGGL